MNVPSNSLPISHLSNPAKGSLCSRFLSSLCASWSGDWADFDPSWLWCAFHCRDLIERLIKLGFYYRELDRFAKKSRNLSWIRSVTSVHPLDRADELSKQSREKKPSVYRRAIANGIGEILAVYRSAVLHIEQKLLAETTPILATVTQGLNKVHFQLQYQHFYHLMTELRITIWVCVYWNPIPLYLSLFSF